MTRVDGAITDAATTRDGPAAQATASQASK
jgi:hypothetical protein